jgi:hypothetical protein
MFILPAIWMSDELWMLVPIDNGMKICCFGKITNVEKVFKKEHNLNTIMFLNIGFVHNHY